MLKSPLHVVLAATLAVTCLAPAPAAWAANGQAVTVADVLALVQKNDGKTRFQARRAQQCIRQDMILDAEAKVDFIDNEDFQIALQNPREVKGLNLMLEKNKLTAFFPRETLLFQSDSPAGADEIKDLVMGRLTADPAGLMRNYKVSVDPELDVIALFPCYKLTCEPVAGFGPGSPPGHRFWVARETGILMKEERFWGSDQAAYFTSRYDSLSLTARPGLSLALPAKVNKLKLAQGTPTEMRRFATPEQARAAGKAIYVPASVPAGFKLRAVDVMSLYGTDIVLLRYNDGLSNMVVTYRTKPNFFLTLMAGAFALALVDKISALSYHAPNNYAVLEKGDHLVYAYGDLWVETLKGIAGSVPVPEHAPPKQGAAGSAG